MLIPNRLANGISPYLLQHAYNPIDWYRWSAEALSRAKQEDKPILLSIGYAACHWCHVMARETFEDLQVADIMNEYFVCIKVDREEQPDIDQLYIEAMQAMGLQVGWPLHVFLLPNQQPFYGGTYFPKLAWKELLLQIATAFKEHRQQLEDSASQFTKALYRHCSGAREQGNDNIRTSLATLGSIFQSIYQELDNVRGGIKGSPKFPIPSVGAFLLNYYRLTHDQRALDQLTLTLIQMACGGIYDQLGGGFARYATDSDWLIPHFEKMLYDNAQLISLYAQAYLSTQNQLYKQVIVETVACLERELMDSQGAFYSSIDADSEGIEGKFYTWSPAEVAHVLQSDFSWFVEYFHMVPCEQAGQGAHILARNSHVEVPEAQTAKLEAAKQALFDRQSQRTKPSVDNKILASWNGMLLQALVDAYYALGNPHFLELACKNAAFMQQYLIKDNQVIHTYYQGKLGNNSYVEDYAWMIRALISLYQATFEETWLAQAASLLDHAIQRFWEEQTCLFCTTKEGEYMLIAHPKEVFDQAIPSSNAVMAHNLFYLSTLLGRKDYAFQAQQMIRQIMPLLQENPFYLTHWASLCALQSKQVITVAILGPQCKAWAYELKKTYPDILLVGTTTESKIPLLKDKRTTGSQSSIHICYEQTCQLPVESLQEAFQLLQPAFLPSC